jgi:hypothetical protein
VSPVLVVSPALGSKVRQGSLAPQDHPEKERQESRVRRVP